MGKRTPEFWKTTGNEYFRTGRYAIAIRCYARAITLDPGYIEGWNNLGFTYQKLGKIAEARRCNEKIRELKLKLTK